MKRVVVDTNVTISALFWGGYPRKLYELIRAGKVTLLLSHAIEAELFRVLSYAKFGLTLTEILPLLNDIRKYAEFVKTISKIEVVAQDPTDNIFIECAWDGKADYLISGDHHLLDLGSYQGIQILKAKDFLLKEGLGE